MGQCDTTNSAQNRMAIGFASWYDAARKLDVAVTLSANRPTIAAEWECFSM